MVSTVAAGDVAKYVGGADIMMFHSVADVQGLNSITEQVLANAAHAMAGMVRATARRRGLGSEPQACPAGASASPCSASPRPAVQAVTKRLEAGLSIAWSSTPPASADGRWRGLADSRLLAALIDLTTTEIADMLVGGVFPATADRFGAAIRTGLPYVGSVGALDMVNFGPRDSVPEKFRSRKFVIHNPNVTLMRTTRDENRASATGSARGSTQMNGPVRFLLPEGGVSMLDAPGQAVPRSGGRQRALFEAIEQTVRAERPAPRRAGAGQHQRSGLRRGGVRRVSRDARQAAEKRVR